MTRLRPSIFAQATMDWSGYGGQAKSECLSAEAHRAKAEGMTNARLRRNFDIRVS